MFERIRLFPVMIAVLLVFMGARTLDVWTGVESGIGAISSARASGSEADDTHEPAAEEHSDTSHTDKPADSHSRSGDTSDLSSEGYMSAADVDIMNSMEDRDAKYEAWESELKMRTRMLEVAESKVEGKIAELRELETTLRKLVEIQSEKEDADLNRLVKVYESMKPKDSAPIIQLLDEDTQLAIAARMKETKLAAIFAKMDDDTPQKLTVRLMERSEMPEELVSAE